LNRLNNRRSWSWLHPWANLAMLIKMCIFLTSCSILTCRFALLWPILLTKQLSA